MKPRIRKYFEKGLIPNTTKLAQSIYISDKGITPWKEYKVIKQIHETARRLKNQIKKVSFDAYKSDEEMQTVDAFSVRFTLASPEDADIKYPSDLLPTIQSQLDALVNTVDVLTNRTDMMMNRVESFVNKGLKVDDTVRPLLVIDIFAELYELLYEEKPTIGDTDYPSKFEKFAQDLCDEIGFKEKVRSYAKKLAKNKWKTSGLIKTFVIPPILGKKIPPPPKKKKPKK